MSDSSVFRQSLKIKFMCENIVYSYPGLAKEIKK